MRYIAGCCFSAVLASLFTVWLTTSSMDESAVAQDRNVRRGPVFSLEHGQADSGSLPDELFNDEGLSPEEAINVSVYEERNRSVVNITTKGSRADGLFLLEIPSEGTGSGSILDKAGHVLTNYHVVEDAREIQVTLYDGNTYEATLVGADPINDIAVIQIETPPETLFPITFGDSNELRVGMRVFAIGNPFGLERTMTTGIISSLNRSLQLRGNRTIRSIIQIDAAVNPGNSGGPLLDSRGRLIGINTAIASRNGQSAGVGFAIPVNLVARVVPQLIRHGRVIRPEIGILRVYETDRGLMIAAVTPNGPADKAGLRGPQLERRRRGPFVIERVDRSAADLIIEVDGEEVKTADDFLGYIESKRPGDRIQVTIIREGRRMVVPVELGGPDNF